MKKLFVATILCMTCGCVKMGRVYKSNDVVYIQSEEEPTCVYIKDADEASIACAVKKFTSEGLVEIGRAERVSDMVANRNECWRIARREKASAALYYNQIVGREFAGMYMVSPYYGTSLYEDEYRSVLILFGKPRINNPFGLSFADLTEAEMRMADSRTGAKIVYVLRDSPAWSQNVFEGDVLISIDGHSVKNAAEAERLACIESDSRRLVIARGEKRLTKDLSFRTAGNGVGR